MDNHPSRYELLAQPSPGGLRFFTGYHDNGHPGGVYVADTSGRTPASTDDGPLRLEGVITVRSHGVFADVSSPEGKRSVVALSMPDVDWLRRNDRIDRLIVAPSMVALARVFASVPWEVGS